MLMKMNWFYVWARKSSRNQILLWKWEKQIRRHPTGCESFLSLVGGSVHTSSTHETHYSLAGRAIHHDISHEFVRCDTRTRKALELHCEPFCIFPRERAQPKRFLWIQKMFVHSAEKLSDYDINKGIWYDKKTKKYLFLLFAGGGNEKNGDFWNILRVWYFEQTAENKYYLIS